MTTYDFCKFLIAHKRYEYETMTRKLDILMLAGRIADAQYAELIGMMTPPAATTATPTESA